MHNSLKCVPSWSWTQTLLVVIALTACAPIPTPTPDATPQITLPVTPSTALPLSPSPLPRTPLPTSTPLGTVAIDTIRMMDRLTGWGIGQIGTEGPSRLLRTTDGGATWQDVSPGSQSYDGPSALNAQLAWAHSTDNGGLWRTQDGGQSWTSLGQIQGSIWFNDSQHGWKMDAEAWGLSYVQFDIQSFSTTQDGGQTWQETAPPPGAGVAFLAFPDPQTAWAIRAGFAKTIEGSPNLAVPFSLVTTMDGGKMWESQSMPLPPKVDVVEMNDGASYLAAGNCEFGSPVYSSTVIWKLALMCEDQGWLYTTIDQGKTWTTNPLPAGHATEVQFIDPTMGWSLRRDEGNPYRSQLYQTTDGGQTWAMLARLNWADAQLDFLDDHTGWAVAVTCDEADCNPYFYPKALAKTTDRGHTWQIIQPQIVP